MRTKLLTVALVVAVFMAGAVAHAATPWRVFGSASDQGEYFTSVYASGKVVTPKALALRVSGQATDVSWTLICQGKTKALQRAGVSVIAVSRADTCDVSGVVTGKSGSLRVQLLRR